MTAARVVIAGGAGFLGSHLCDRLLDRGDSVICVDNCSTGSIENIEHNLGHPRFRFVEHDVVQTGLDMHIVEIWGDSGPTRVLHLASPASPPEYLRRPIETLDVGSIGTKRLLELATRHDARFFLASTSEVYGDPLVHPQTESYWGNVNPTGEWSVYDESKRFAEALTMAYHRAHGLDVRIVRIFTTYGPRMQADDGRVVTNFVNQALRGEPLTMYGDGSQTRSFCYVDDEVAGLVAALDGPLTGPVNIGNSTEFTMLQFALLVVELTGSGSAIEYLPLPADDPQRRRPDVTMARDHLGWQASIPLREGLERRSRGSASTFRSPSRGSDRRPPPLLDRSPRPLLAGPISKTHVLDGSDSLSRMWFRHHSYRTLR